MTHLLDPGSTVTPAAHAEALQPLPPDLAMHQTATAFLKAALSPEQTLHDLHEALCFAARRADLRLIRLRDVWAYPGGILRLTPSPAPKAAGQSRRGAAQTRLLKQQVTAALDSSRDGLSTPALRDALSRSGHRLSTAQVNVLLKSMAQGGLVHSSNSRPRVWQRLGPVSRPTKGVVIRPAVSPAARTDVGTSRQSSLFS